MRLRTIVVSAYVTAGILALSASAGAQTVAAGPYYATPSWDQTIACTTPANCTRFVVLSNFNSEAVLDRESGLVWERTPATGTLSLLQADNSCNGKTIGGRQGWRLPTIHEIRTLFDPTRTSPALPAGHPFLNVLSGTPPFVTNYWSRTPSYDGFSYFGVTFFSASATVGLNPSAGASAFHWCVRGPGSLR